MQDGVSYALFVEITAFLASDKDLQAMMNYLEEFQRK